MKLNCDVKTAAALVVLFGAGGAWLSGPSRAQVLPIGCGPDPSVIARAKAAEIRTAQAKAMASPSPNEDEAAKPSAAQSASPQSAPAAGSPQSGSKPATPEKDSAGSQTGSSKASQ